MQLFHFLSMAVLCMSLLQMIILFFFGKIISSAFILITLILVDRIDSNMVCSMHEIQDIRQVLFLKIPEARKALLVSEIDRVAQVYL